MEVTRKLARYVVESRYADIPEKVRHAKVSAKELDMALRLVDDMSDAWQPEKYRDTYHEDLRKRIEEKVRAGQTEQLTEPAKEAKTQQGGEVIDLMALLKKSVEKRSQKSDAEAKPRRHARKRRAA